MSVIHSILDTDFYKLSMQNAVLVCYPGTPVTYRFINRCSHISIFNDLMYHILREEIEAMSFLSLSTEEEAWLRKNTPLDERYINWLRNYRFDPSEVVVSLTNGELEIEIVGSWERTILWEVPLMAIISELYHRYCDIDGAYNQKHHIKNIERKAYVLRQCQYSDFGTRRRRCYEAQNELVSILCHKPGFVGTSNPYFAKIFDTKVVGTMAHEWIMGISVLEGLRHANRFALNKWVEVYKGKLGIALTDTFGVNAFFDDFDDELSHLYVGVRHDSGDPYEFARRVIMEYEKRGIDPATKTIVFSDWLNAYLASNLERIFRDKINMLFGIGTNFTNDFQSPALNMVIKMHRCCNVPVVKLSSVNSKRTGDVDAIKNAVWTFGKV